jgi:succinate dehydrogenase/fumarate reductase flavoprotein subunit
MLETSRAATDASAYILADHRALRAYGLGAVPPAPARLRPWVRNGYLVTAPSLAALAERMGVPADALVSTVQRFNRAARAGQDPDFGRGVSRHNRHYGDSAHQPNASLGPLETPPYFAVRIFPSDIGGFIGLRTDCDARVIGVDGAAIPGLYAVGNDSASLFGGAYPAGGSTIGPALVFGGLAALHLARGGNDASKPGPGTQATNPLPQIERMRLS